MAWVPVFRFRSLVLSPIAVIGIGLGACRSPERAQGNAAKMVDDFGNAIPTGKAPARIVSLNPTTTEILCAIGAGKRLVGRAQYDIYPEAAKTVPSLGIALRPSVEAIVAAH